MNQLITKGIVLARTDYGEADRILTMLTPDAGKLRLMAKGVRRLKSKLAGGIELFSTTELVYIKGRGEIGTLVSARLERYYSGIVKDVERTMLGYELIKQLNRETEDEPEADYYHLLEQAFAALEDKAVPLDIIRLWFPGQLLRLSGHTPNLTHELDGTKLSADQTYEFSFDDSTFLAKPQGAFTADDIKFLRLVFSGNSPKVLAKVSGAEQLANNTKQLVQFMAQQYIH
jgi:DNA repair protein RecO (recombination protein O)